MPKSEVNPEFLSRLGLNPDGLGIIMSIPGGNILKILGNCGVCGLLRVSYFNKADGTFVTFCPRKGESVSNSCFWGGRGNLPIGEE
ncbi:MAG TPA: hypothetical protein VI819_05015 [Patescibacteria group bacterium]|nr:hypothetical protein [Patescibacteria group bacterium]